MNGSCLSFLSQPATDFLRTLENGVIIDIVLYMHGDMWHMLQAGMELVCAAWAVLRQLNGPLRKPQHAMEHD